MQKNNSGLIVNCKVKKLKAPIFHPKFSVNCFLIMNQNEPHSHINTHFNYSYRLKLSIQNAYKVHTHTESSTHKRSLLSTSQLWMFPAVGQATLPLEWQLCHPFIVARVWLRSLPADQSDTECRRKSAMYYNLFITETVNQINILVIGLNKLRSESKQ